MAWTMNDKYFWFYGRELPWIPPEEVYNPDSEWNIIHEMEDSNGKTFNIVKRYGTKEIGYTSL